MKAAIAYTEAILRRRLLHDSLIIMVAAALLLPGCAAVPPQTVTLSTAVGQDVLAIKKSHIFYINSYYDRLEYEANRIIDQDYTPMLIGAALRGDSGKLLMQKIEAGKSGGQAAQDATAFMQRFLENVKARVDAQRSKVVGGIQTARQQALSNADAAYAQVVQGNATITAYLVSLVKLHSAQDELFKSAGVPTFQDDVAENLANASDKVGTVADQAKAGENALDNFEKTLEELVNIAKGKN